MNIFTFLTPAFALVIGAHFFGETLTLVEIGGIALILAGIVWMSRQTPTIAKCGMTYPVSAGEPSSIVCQCC